MLGRHERRSLDEIEKRLTEEEPQLARSLASTALPSGNRLLTVLTVVSAVVVVLCLFLGEFGSFLLVTGLITALLWLRRWKLTA
jgi:hypothetical protein